MEFFKLTDENNETGVAFRSPLKWGPDVSHKASGDYGLIHAYKTAKIAVFVNPIHMNFKNPNLWIAEGEAVQFEPTGISCSWVKTLRPTALPVVSDFQRNAFAILLLRELNVENDFVKEMIERILKKEEINKATFIETVLNLKEDPYFLNPDFKLKIACKVLGAVVSDNGANALSWFRFLPNNFEECIEESLTYN